ncbi:chemotaxis response regulator protein-glutamate methylesterase [Novosphingobium sp.]|uniref:protein-glutamate methylesterase/protein-glutamine glutaminase n=1 Tax=Novosphingobium sp. TaxID=1874826 RepID=UPI0030176C6F
MLVVDDSKIARRWIIEALSHDHEIEVVGVASDPYEARDQILALNPDVITLDLEMPRMDGLSFLKILNQHHPMPVVVVSALTPRGSELALAALAAGAVDVIAKANGTKSIRQVAKHLAQQVKAAAQSRLGSRATQTPASAPVPAPALRESRVHSVVVEAIVIGASTGGVEALRHILPRLPEGLPPIVIVQHIPAGFSRGMANNLNKLCAFPVHEAEDQEELTSNLCLIAPGGYHLTLTGVARDRRVRLSQSPPVHHCRPAVDVLFRSAAETLGKKAVGALLTGMGVDGARGLSAMRARGARTLAQDEESSVVFGMPKAAISMGAAELVVALSDMPRALVRAATTKKLAEV